MRSIDRYDLQRTCPHDRPNRGALTEETEWQDKRPAAVVTFQHCHCPRCGMLFERFVSRRPAVLA